MRESLINIYVLKVRIPSSWQVDTQGIPKNPHLLIESSAILCRDLFKLEINFRIQPNLGGYKFKTAKLDFYPILLDRHSL